MLPEAIELTVTDQGKPCCGALVRVELLATRKNNFSSYWGPTDAEGKVCIERAELVIEGEQEGELFLMDYGHPEKDFAGQIRISVASRDAIARALKAFGEWSGCFPFRSGYETMLKNGLARWDTGQIVDPCVTGHAIGAAPILIFEK